MSNLKIKKSRIFEVFESEGRSKKLYTKNLVPGKKVYGEKLVFQDNVEYREWDPYKSKLSAAILKGCQNIFIRKDSVVLYLGSASGTTVSHISDIASEGFIFAVDIAGRVVRDLMFLCYDRNNIAPILADANKVKELAERVSKVDVVYQDIAQKEQLEIFLKNVELFLDDKGYCILALKARSIDAIKKPGNIFKEVKDKLQSNLILIDYRELEPFQKDHAMFICKK